MANPTPRATLPNQGRYAPVDPNSPEEISRHAENLAACARLNEAFESMVPGAVKRRSMTQHQAPVGTIAVLGHVANSTRIVKTGVGWRYLHNDTPVADEDFRAGWDTIGAEQPAPSISN